MIKKILMHRRGIYGFIVLLCTVLMGSAFYLQYTQGLEPCPLCMIQRYIMLSIAAVALLGLLHGPGGWGHRLYGLFLAIFAIGGTMVAGRQIWLQSLPEDQVPACGADFDFIVNNFPLMKAAETLWKGSGDCAEVQWVFLGLSIPGWTLVWFALFALAGLYLLLRPAAGSRH